MEAEMTSKKDDWCHLCGRRTTEEFLDIHYPENAEHDRAGEKGTKYVRMCRGCIATLATIAGVESPKQFSDEWFIKGQIEELSKVAFIGLSACYETFDEWAADFFMGEFSWDEESVERQFLMLKEHADFSKIEAAFNERFPGKNLRTMLAI